MRHLLIITLCSLSTLSFGQSKDIPNPVEVTPDSLVHMKAIAEKEAEKFGDVISKKNGLSPESIKFSVDTFKIQSIVKQRETVDYSTTGIDDAIVWERKSYTKLMNNYYDGLLKLLAPADRQALILSQNEWIKFKDTEVKLIGLMSKEKYSGGGTMQSNILEDRLSEMVIIRTNQLFDYFDSVPKKAN